MNRETVGFSQTERDANRSVARSYDMRYHGTAEMRGGDCPHSRYYASGRFGRLFPTLTPFLADPTALRSLGDAGGPMDAADGGADNPTGLEAGFTFLGQFIDHDITFDPTSSLERQIDPEAVNNFRTPHLELDSVYGSGPGASPHLYQKGTHGKFLLSEDGNDLPRNREDVALLGDPRNDENLIVSQMHLAFLKFHNAVFDSVASAPPARGSVFEETQRTVRWHYQWLIVHEFLPRIVGHERVERAFAERRLYRPRNEAFIPVEFSVAAYRFGHSQVRPGYQINGDFGARLFGGADDLSGGRRITADKTIEWSRFFATPGADNTQASKAIDIALSSPLLALPFASGDQGDPQSLATRNLLRGVAFGLPSGQDVARHMDIAPLSPEEIGDAAGQLGFGDHTPLWFYILKEAEVRQNGGLLGDVGGRIVAEVMIGLLMEDRMSYLRANPSFRPFLTGPDFTMVNLLQTAGVA
jgi:hypothetical protein